MSKVVVKVRSEVDVLRYAIKMSGEDAYRSALSHGVTVTVLQGDKIQRVQPDGKKVTVGKIAKTNNKVLPTRIRLK
jgi:hypothetical protein